MTAATLKRRQITMAVTVSVPAEMTDVEARREVRTLITDQCNWSADPDDVKAVKVTTLAKALSP